MAIGIGGEGDAKPTTGVAVQPQACVGVRGGLGGVTGHDRLVREGDVVRLKISATSAR
ncbi:hypothetical protein [Euzebya sp.]|uniref:hypothetical protein n=1 Tax=Euzebya sp. TaxID=1971409 RepID=UPI00351893BF